MFNGLVSVFQEVVPVGAESKPSNIEQIFSNSTRKKPIRALRYPKLKPDKVQTLQLVKETHPEHLQPSRGGDGETSPTLQRVEEVNLQTSRDGDRNRSPSLQEVEEVNLQTSRDGDRNRSPFLQEVEEVDLFELEQEKETEQILDKIRQVSLEQHGLQFVVDTGSELQSSQNSDSHSKFIYIGTISRHEIPILCTLILSFCFQTLEILPKANPSSSKSRR